MHRDLKPQNLLVDVKTKTIKLADFGLGRVFTLPVLKYTHEVVTLWYRAPEILLGTRCDSPAVDIWSVGCILAEMILGRPIFCGECEIEQLLAIFRVLGTPNSQTWPNVQSHRDWHAYPQWNPVPLATAVKWPTEPSQETLELLEGMLQLDPAKRLTAIDALKSPYFDDIRHMYTDTHAGDAHIVGDTNKENESMLQQ